MKPDAWVLNLLEQGYKLPFKDGEPGQAYLEKNNKSALDNLPFVRESVKKYLDKDVIQRWKQRPLCVSPLTVASRELDSEEEIKNRLCLDLSRWINKLLQKENVTLPSLDKVLKTLLPGDFMATYDLSSAYHHVRIHPDHWKYLGFAVPNQDTGEDEYYVFTCMPFGLASATHCLARITKPLCALLAKEGIRNSIYIDDGWIPALLKILAQQHLERTLQVLQQAGFVVSEEKTDSAEEVSQTKEYLGFIVNSLEMTVSASTSKLKECRTLLIEAVREKQIKAKRLAKVIGKVIALEIATGPVVQLLTRMAQAELAETVEAAHWQVTVILSQEARESLELLASVLPEFNGFPIRNEATAIPLNRFVQDSADIQGKSIYGANTVQNPAVIASDASQVAACAYDVQAAGGLFVQSEFTEVQAAQASGHRELLAVVAALQEGTEALKHEFNTRSVFWLTDSANLVTFLTKGSTKKAIQTDVFKVFKLAREIKLDIIPVHLHREDFRIQVADFGSRYYDADDWAIDRQSFLELTRFFEPTIDLFAHFSNAKCERFYSFGKAPHTAGVDAFAQDWNHEAAWCCPPVSKIVAAVQKIEASTMSAIVVTPAWASASFWPFMFPDGKSARKSCVRLTQFNPTIWRGKYCYNKLMQGKTPFAFLAFYLRADSSGTNMEVGKIPCPTIKYNSYK